MRGRLWGRVETVYRAALSLGTDEARQQEDSSAARVNPRGVYLF